MIREANRCTDHDCQPANSDPFGYTDAELLKIEAAGRLAVAALQQLRDRDERKRAEPYVPWTVSAGQGPEQPTEGN